jgi:hypothetical protein
MEPQPVFRIRFIGYSNFIGEVIQWSTNSIWAHTEIGTEAGTWIGARDQGGVEERPANYCTPDRERRYEIPITAEQDQKIMAFARSKIGTPYNFEDIAGLFLHDRSITGKGRYICSMFALECAMAGGLEMLNVLDIPQYTALITPETLHLSPLLIGRCVYNFGK